MEKERERKPTESARRLDYERQTKSPRGKERIGNVGEGEMGREENMKECERQRDIIFKYSL